MLLIILFLTGLFAGTVDAIAGGGGLISLPVLLSLGVPPHLAFGTNKLQGTIGTFVATLKYHRHGLIAKSTIFYGIIFGLIGASSGAIASQILSTEILRQIIPILLLVIFFYTLFSPHLGLHDKKPRLGQFTFYLIFGFGLSFYDGFFGPGTGSLWVFVLTFFLGYNLIKATAYTKIFNFNSSFVATLCFAAGGNIDYRLGFCMAAGQIIGGRLGAHLAIVKGAQIIRPLFLAVVISTISTLIYKSYLQSGLRNVITQKYGLMPQIALVLLIAGTFIVMIRRFNKKPA